MSKLDLPSHLERSYVANALRARAIRQRKLALTRSKTSIRAELNADADFAELIATRLDDAEESADNGAEPIQVDARRDIDAVDEPNGK